MAKEKKHRFKLKKILILIAFIIVLAYVIFEIYNLIKNPTNTFIINNGKLYMEESAEGYILRDEIVVKGDNYKNEIVKIKNEGEKLAKGESIFRYKSDKEDELNKNIDELNIKIQDAMKNEKGILNSDITLLENQIKEKIKKIYGMNNYQKVTSLKKEINDLILKKAEIVGELSPSGSYIKDLIKKRNSLEDDLNAVSEYVKAPMSGVVSYKIDGYEEHLSAKNIEALNPRFLMGFDVESGKVIENSNGKAKVVNNYEAYIAVIIKSDEAKKAKIGDKVDLEFLNLESVSASIERISEEDDGTRVIVFKLNDYVEKLIEYRKISVNIIWWSKKGLKVPNSAIINKEDGLSYVLKNKAGYKEEILVKVLRKNENYTIIGNYTTDELKDIGYTSSQISKMKKIFLYDEVFVLNKE